MNDREAAQCAHKRVEQYTEPYGKGVRDKWRCDSCGHQFLPVPAASKGGPNPILDEIPEAFAPAPQTAPDERLHYLEDLIPVEESIRRESIQPVEQGTIIYRDGVEINGKFYYDGEPLPPSPWLYTMKQENEEYEVVELCQGCGKEDCDSCPCGTYRVRRKKEKDVDDE
jgi:hypothetical protein